MLPTTDLYTRLHEIESSYLAETDPVKMKLWAKLAALEVGGWTEECIDKIVEDYLNLKNPPSKDKILKRLEKIYGFHYVTDFKGIWITIIGSISFDKIETSKSVECQRLESALNALKKARDTSAHTYTKANTPIDAPSKIISHLQQIEIGLSMFWSELLTIPN
jgi:hypothetical protein